MASPFFSAFLLSIPSLAASCFATPVVNTNPCRWCAEDLISVTTNGMGSKPMDSDIFDRINGACATRTFTCLGPTGFPQIEMQGCAMNGLMLFVLQILERRKKKHHLPLFPVNSNGGIIRDMDDGATDGWTSFTVTCNGLGTAWISGGVAVNSVECSVAPPCTMCAANLITVDPANPADPGSKAMDSDTLGMAGGCTTRTFTCTGSNPVIEINGGASMVTDGATATLVVTCNAAGTAWESNGAPVTEVSCNIPCKRCTAADVFITQSFFGMTPTTDATIDRTGPCTKWNLVCTGPSMQIWELNGGEGTFGDAADGVIDGVANILTTCSETGFFTYMGINIITADCAAGL